MLGRGMELDALSWETARTSLMPMLLHALPHRRRSRRRTRTLQTRALIATVVLLLCVCSAWRPWTTAADAGSPTASTLSGPLPVAGLEESDPEESIDTEGALADRYIADR